MVNTKINQPILNPQDLTKQCTKCKILLPATLDYFYKNKGGKYGLTPRCKPCVNEDNNKWNINNKEKARKLANNRSKKHYYKNLEKSREVARKSAAKARRDPIKLEKIKARKRAGGLGLTPEQIEYIRTKQNNKCAICGSNNPTDLDHCHKTNRVRWLLCKHCNRGLGAFKDDPKILRKAASMLENIKYQNQENKPVPSKYDEHG